jgi:tetratricopeptide (TPR) repeat protein
MSKREHFTKNGPLKLSIILTSLLATACSQIEKNEMYQSVFGEANEQENHGKLYNSLNNLNENTSEEDRKFILSEAAKVSAEKKEYTQAMTYWEELLNYYPDYVPAYLGYSNIGRKINAHQKILAKLYDYKTRNPNDATILQEIAKIYYDIKNYNLALEEIDSALTFEKNDWRLYSLRGIINDKLNYFTEARVSYEKALELSPDNSVILNNIAASMIQSNELNDAEFYAVKAMETSNPNMQVYKTYVKILILKGQTEQARLALMQKLQDEALVEKIIASVNSNISQPVLWGRS